jgi:hypothetical protein
MIIISIIIKMMIIISINMKTTELVMRLHGHDYDNTGGHISHRDVPSIHTHVLTPLSTTGTTQLTMSYRRSVNSCCPVS